MGKRATSKRGVSVELPGVHRVRRKLADGSERVHYYAWRGGPKLDPDDLAGSYKRAHAGLTETSAPETIASVIQRFRESPKHQQRAYRSQTEMEALHVLIEKEFGDAPAAILEAIAA